MTEKYLLKDNINKDAIHRISDALATTDPHFNQQGFQRDCLKNLNTLELKARVHHIISVLAKYLPHDFTQAAPRLLAIKRHWHAAKPDNPLCGFAAWPLIDYVSVYGLEHPELALKVLKELTPLFSAEFAIQPFIIQHFNLTLAHLHIWCNDEDEQVRRLASEGCRPRLPWGLRLQHFCDDPSPILPLLEKLKNDNSEYVRRSVANNLNDISKDHPTLVINICKQWQRNASKETQWIIKHATRSLVKKGHPDVFSLLGYSPHPQIRIEKINTNKIIALGNTLDFTFTLTSTASTPQKLVVDYAIHHVKANGKTTAKVFKLKTIHLAAGARVNLMKKHPFRIITTRNYYSGKHSIEILVNGVAYNKTDFLLTV